MADMSRAEVIAAFEKPLVVLHSEINRLQGYINANEPNGMLSVKTMRLMMEDTKKRVQVYESAIALLSQQEEQKDTVSIPLATAKQAQTALTVLAIDYAKVVRGYKRSKSHELARLAEQQLGVVNENIRLMGEVLKDK